MYLAPFKESFPVVKHLIIYFTVLPSSPFKSFSVLISSWSSRWERLAEKHKCLPQGQACHWLPVFDSARSAREGSFPSSLKVIHDFFIIIFFINQTTFLFTEVESCQEWTAPRGFRNPHWFSLPEWPESPHLSRCDILQLGLPAQKAVSDLGSKNTSSWPVGILIFSLVINIKCSGLQLETQLM